MSLLGDFLPDNLINTDKKLSSECDNFLSEKDGDVNLCVQCRMTLLGVKTLHYATASLICQYPICSKLMVFSSVCIEFLCYPKQ